MRKYDLCVVVTLTVFTASCGSSHQLQSLAITPAAASPASLSSPVQFKAIGTFTDGHKAEVAAQWTLLPFCPVGAPCPLTLVQPGWIKLNNSGVAECTESGPTWTIHATAPVAANVQPSQITVNTKTVSATAQFTCTQAAS